MPASFIHDTWCPLYKSIEWNKIQEKFQLCCHWTGRWWTMYIHASAFKVSWIANFNFNFIWMGKHFCSWNCRDINLTAVDIDPSMLTVATDYFGLVQDSRLKVVIDDGIKFLKKSVKNGIGIENTLINFSCSQIILSKTETVFQIIQNSSKFCTSQDNHSKRSFSMWIVKTVQLGWAVRRFNFWIKMF